MCLLDIYQYSKLYVAMKMCFNLPSLTIDKYMTYFYLHISNSNVCFIYIILLMCNKLYA